MSRLLVISSDCHAGALPDTYKDYMPKKYHAAVERWRDTFLPDYDYLIASWESYFPKEPQFKLCAYRELGICDHIECGEHEGRPKATKPEELTPEQAQYLLGAIRAQASTEFGSIQQHRLTLARAQSEEEQVWILRMMAEELRHGYQMLHLLIDDDWGSVAQVEAGADLDAVGMMGETPLASAVTWGNAENRVVVSAAALTAPRNIAWSVTA